MYKLKIIFLSEYLKYDNFDTHVIRLKFNE